MIQEHFAISNPRWHAVCLFFLFIYAKYKLHLACRQLTDDSKRSLILKRYVGMKKTRARAFSETNLKIRAATFIMLIIGKNTDGTSLCQKGLAYNLVLFFSLIPLFIITTASWLVTWRLREISLLEIYS